MPALRRAWNSLFALISAGGGLMGNPRRGFPLFFFWACTCAPIRWEVVVGLPCDSTPVLWCLPKETGSSRQRKALFYPGGSTIRVSAPASVDGTHLRPTWGGAGAGRGLGALRVPFAGGERGLLWPLCAVGRLRGCHCRYQVPPTAQGDGAHAAATDTHQPPAKVGRR